MTKRVDTTTDSRDDERRRVADEMAARLRARGVRLDSRESGEELANLLEAVEEFENVVQSHGGDLMVDEPVRADAPVTPDDQAFVLPARQDREGVSTYIDRIAEASARARRVHARE
jgi:hypothetical protein